MLTKPTARRPKLSETARIRLDVDPMLLDAVLCLDLGRPLRVILGDSGDDRVLRAADVLATLGIDPVLIGPAAAIRRRAGGLHIESTDRWHIHDPRGLAESATGERVRERAAVRHPELAGSWLADPLYLAAAGIGTGIGDVVVAGADRPTADVLRAGLAIAGLAPGRSLLSSSFLMRLADGRYMGFGDCAVVPAPDADQLAAIAVDTADTFAALTAQSPSVAMLSFSTAGSAEHTDVDVVRTATSTARERRPDLDIDGELQFDAAVVESVAASKAPASAVAGHANVLIFPNLAAGNIGYKITERLAGARAFGPILQGLSAPINDVSRGAGVADLVNVALISCLQAQQHTAAQSTAAQTPAAEEITTK